MSRIAPTSGEAQTVIKWFCNYVFWLKRVRTTAAELGDPNDEDLLAVAPWFFNDLNELLIEAFMLGADRLLQRPRMSSSQNLSMAYFIEEIDWPGAVRTELEGLRGRLAKFASSVKPARNKILAHSDRATVLAGLTLGAFPEGEDEVVLEAMEVFANVMHEQAFGQIFGEINVAEPGDVLDLKRALQKSLAFDRALERATPDQKEFLLDCFREVTRRGSGDR